MTHTRVFRAGILAWLVCMSHAAMAQDVVVTYDLDNVWLKPDISHPGMPPEQMTGTFEWTYVQGDFENGTGRFTSLRIPWDNPRIDELNITIDMSSIEFSLVGNFHDRGVDVTLFLVEPLSPSRPATIDTARSQFEIQRGISYVGHAISGSVVPRGGLSCELIGKLKVKCKNGKLVAKVKSSLVEGTVLTIDNDGDTKSMTINSRGNGKVKYKNQSGDHTVTIVECPDFMRSVTCR